MAAKELEEKVRKMVDKVITARTNQNFRAFINFLLFFSAYISGWGSNRLSFPLWIKYKKMVSSAREKLEQPPQSVVWASIQDRQTEIVRGMPKFHAHSS